jgi:hypothetical protein
MPIDISNEDIFPLSEAQQRSLPGVRRKINNSTWWRWCTDGSSGIRLEHVRIGSRIFTSTQAVSRFVNAVAHAKETSRSTRPVAAKQPNITDAAKRLQQTRDERALDDAGIV